MITIDTLMKQCLVNNESPKQFRILYNQLVHRQHIDPIELFTGLKSSLQYYYILEIFNYELGISKLFAILVQYEQAVQLQMIKLLLQDGNIIKDKDLDLEFNKYLKVVLPKCSENENDRKDLIINIFLLIKNLNLNPSQESLNQILEMSSAWKLPLLRKQSGVSMNKNVNLYRFIKIKKFVWLNYQVLNYQLQNSLDEFINSFINLINNSSLNYVFMELLSSSFECMNVAEIGREMIHVKNWEFLIINKLPLIFQSHLKINQENFENILDKSLPLLNNFNIKLNFLKSLVSLKLIKLEKFYHLIGTTDNVIEINELLKFKNELVREYTKFEEFNYIQDTINKNLIESNPEFTTIDNDNKLYNFLKKFNLNNVKLKQEFADIISKTIVQLCDEKDSTRLRRLLFCLSSNMNTLDIVIFNSKPNLILQKLVEICCNSDYLNDSGDAEDISMFGDDDDENYQELYTDFSCILMHILFISRRYHLSLRNQNLFILNLLHNFEISTSMISDSNMNLKEWYGSIYNDNESLISDVLIAKTSIINSFQLIPIIFNYSILQYQNNEISFDLLMNGFEFFMQPFLIINLIPIFYKLNEFLWCSPQLSDLIWKICHRILDLKLDGESKLMFELIWNYVQVDFQHWRKFESTNEDYVLVMAKFNTVEQPVTKHNYHDEFIRHLNGLVNWNLQDLKLDIYQISNETNHDTYKIINNVIAEMGKILDHSVLALHDEDRKNLTFVNYLEISSFNLLVLIKFDKLNLKNLNSLLNNEFNNITQPSFIITDLKFLLQNCQTQGKLFEIDATLELIKKMIQHLSNL